MLAAMLSQLHAQRQTLQLPDVELSYLEWHQGQEPVLLLHGMADHSLVWAQLGNHLSDRYHLLAPDLRGHGNSSKPATGYRCSDVMQDLAALIAAKGWTSTHVVAHSWAAKVATVWATQQPQAIRSLVLVDPFFINAIPQWFKLTFPVLYRTLPFLKMMGPFANYHEAQQQARKLKQYQGWSAWQQVVFEAGLEQHPNGTWGSKFVVQARDEIFADVMAIAGLTTPLATPTLLIQPERGLNRSAWQLQPFRTYLNQLQITKVPGHHWCFLVDAIAFNPVVAQFLDAQTH